MYVPKRDDEHEQCRARTRMKTSKTMEEKYYLPEGIIHHILSYLNPKEGAQISVLSKDWLSACQTNPILKFSEQYFRDSNQKICKEGKAKFQNYVNRTLLNYPGRHIQEFDLSMSIQESNDNDDDDSWASLVNQWLEIAVNKGIRKLQLNIHVDDHERWYVVPPCVLEAKSLTCLSLSGCKFLQDNVNGKLLFNNIRIVSLCKVYIDDEMFRSFIISGCPLIDFLKILDCHGLKSMKINLRSLKNLDIIMNSFVKEQEEEVKVEVEVNAPNLEIVELAGKLNLVEFHACQNLKSLTLTDIRIPETLFHNFANKFPHVEILHLLCCHGLQRIKLTSQSIKDAFLDSYSFEGGWPEIDIDAPNMNNFQYHNHAICMRRESFRGVFSSQCATHMDIEYSHIIFTFRDALILRKFMSDLSPSSLNICTWKMKVRERQKPIPDILSTFSAANAIEIEGLNLQIGEKISKKSYENFLDGLLWACHPKIVVQSYLYYEDEDISTSGGINFIKILHEKLMIIKDRRNMEEFSNITLADHCSTSKNYCWQDDLKKTEFKIYDEDGYELMILQESLDWYNWPNVSKIRCKIEWKESSKNKEERAQTYTHRHALKLEH